MNKTLRQVLMASAMFGAMMAGSVPLAGAPAVCVGPAEYLAWARDSSPAWPSVKEAFKIEDTGKVIAFAAAAGYPGNVANMVSLIVFAAPQEEPGGAFVLLLDAEGCFLNMRGDRATEIMGASGGPAIMNTTAFRLKELFDRVGISWPRDV